MTIIPLINRSSGPRDLTVLRRRTLLGLGAIGTLRFLSPILDAQTTVPMPTEPVTMCKLLVQEPTEVRYHDVVLRFENDLLVIEGLEPFKGTIRIPYDDIRRIVHRQGHKRKWYHYVLFPLLFVATRDADWLTLLFGKTGPDREATLKLEDYKSYQVTAALENATGLRVQWQGSSL